VYVIGVKESECRIECVDDIISVRWGYSDVIVIVIISGWDNK
jgi:hypothetical protein